MPDSDLTPTQRSFLARHVGVALAGDGTKTESLTAIWRDAKEEADTGISALQNAMKSSDVPAFNGLANHGLHKATEGRLSRLMAALMDVDRDPGAAGKAKSAVAEMQSFLDGAKIISLLEDNPLGVAVSLRAPLGTALSRIERALKGLA